MLCWWAGCGARFSVFTVTNRRNGRCNPSAKKEAFMPVQVTYPGVYIEEIPSGVQTITGVATSITAFMGTALCGPLGYDPVTNEANPITIFSFTDYQRIFGGLWVNSPMSY